MSLERAAMRGILAEAKDKQSSLRQRVESASSALRTGLNTFITPADELQIPQLDEQWDVLKEAWAELQVANETIRRLERELR